MEHQGLEPATFTVTNLSANHYRTMLHYYYSTPAKQELFSSSKQPTFAALIKVRKISVTAETEFL